MVLLCRIESGLGSIAYTLPEMFGNGPQGPLGRRQPTKGEAPLGMLSAVPGYLAWGSTCQTRKSGLQSLQLLSFSSLSFSSPAVCLDHLKARRLSA